MNVKLVKEEFNKERGLKPVKIAVLGPPGCGKSFYGGQLAKHYNVPHVYMEKLLQEIEEWDAEKEFLWGKRV